MTSTTATCNCGKLALLQEPDWYPDFRPILDLSDVMRKLDIIVEKLDALTSKSAKVKRSLRNVQRAAK